jgi:hypothetical protein
VGEGEPGVGMNAPPPRHQVVLAAVAARQDYTAAAELLGRRRGAVIVQASRARRSFLALWHKGEAPSRPWKLGRTGKGSTRNRGIMYSITIRENKLRRQDRDNVAAPLPLPGSAPPRP